MAHLWKLGGLTWMELGRRVIYKAFYVDDVFSLSAQLSYYFLLSLFPLLLILTVLFGFMVAGTELRGILLNYFAQVLPWNVYQLVRTTLDEIAEGAGGGKLGVGVLTLLWAASNAIAAIQVGVNKAYGVQEGRPWYKARAVAIGLTVALAFFVFASLLIVIFGNWLGAWLAAVVGFETLFIDLWAVVQWPMVVFFVLVALDMIYRFAPDLKDQHWTWVSPGAAVAVGLWLLFSLGFRLYLRHLGQYSAAYGSLGTVIILLFWLYLSGAAILIGAEVNSEIEDAAAKRREPGARRKGEKRIGEKQAGGIRQRPSEAG